jgi:hypothetical protein
MKEIFRLQNSPPFVAKFLVIGPVGICQNDKCHVDESEMMGTHSRSENGRSARDALYDAI